MPEKITYLLAADDAGFKKKAAQIFLESAAAAVQNRKQFTVLLCGGTTPRPVYELLADPYYKQRIPWESCYFFWGDERCVPPQHSESNFRLAKEAFLSKAGLPDDHLFRIPGEMAPPEAARAYEFKLKSFFKLDLALPRFDLAFLGLGEDGHTASLFPGTAALKEKFKWVTAHHVDSLGASRITATVPLLNAARKILFLCSGAAKAGILKEVLREDMPTNRYPAQMIHPTDGELIWLFDKNASAKLPGGILNQAFHL